MNILINISGGYMVSCAVFERASMLMECIHGIDFITTDSSTCITATPNVIEYHTEMGDQTFVVIKGVEIKKNPSYVYVVSTLQDWSVDQEAVAVFSSYKEARKYYDALRKRSPQYEEIIEADGDNDNFLDDREYAVFLEKADYVK